MSANTNSLSFTAASSQYGTASSIAAYAPSSYTIEAWVKPSSVTGSHNILAKDVAGNRQFVFRLQGAELQIEHYDSSGTSYTIASTNASISTGTWTHVAVVNNAGTFTFYKNGTSLTNGSSSGTYGAQGSKTVSLTVGRRDFSDNEEYFDGLIDEVRFWNTARTAQNISDNRNLELVGNESGLIGYWKFNDGTGTTATDTSSNANSFSLVNTPTWSTDVPFTNLAGGAAFLFNFI